ncbi:hypothetical protein JCM5350_006511 [Sporobolomyces pararoseus]
MDPGPETLNTYSCRWRFCSSTFPSPEALKQHLEAHIREAEPWYRILSPLPAVPRSIAPLSQNSAARSPPSPSVSSLF